MIIQELHYFETNKNIYIIQENDLIEPPHNIQILCRDKFSERESYIIFDNKYYRSFNTFIINYKILIYGYIMKNNEVLLTDRKL